MGVFCFEGCMQNGNLSKVWINIIQGCWPIKGAKQGSLSPPSHFTIETNVYSPCFIKSHGVATKALMVWFNMWLIAKLGHILMLGGQNLQLNL